MQERKNIRLKEYDYSSEGYYFITICTKKRLEILSKIDLENVGVALLGDPKTVILTEIGKIAKKHLENCEQKIQSVRIDEYIIMPNHIHLIIELKNGSPRTATPTIPKIINAYKSMVSKEIKKSIWQRNYYEHVIRNEKEYLMIKQYIIDNPFNWENDEYNQ